MSDGAVGQELCAFAGRLLEECGGLVDWDGDRGRGEAVLPEEVARLLGCGETVALSTQAEPHGLHLALGSEFLDRAEHVLRRFVPATGTFAVPDRYLKRGDLQEAVDAAFTWHNARVRVAESGPTRLEYHAWWFRGTLRSDDAWEQRLSLTLNADTLCPVDLPNPLSLPDLHGDEDDGSGPHPATGTDRAATTFAAAAHLMQRRMLMAADEFLRRMDGRLERDRRRIRDYYASLQKQAGAVPKRSTAPPPTPEETASRKRAVDLERQRKLHELEERYAMEATLEPLALVRTATTALEVRLHVQRRKAERTHVVHWNPLVKQFEPLRCGACGEGTFSVTFTDDDVAPRCTRCAESKSPPLPPPLPPPPRPPMNRLAPLPDSPPTRKAR